MEHEATAKATSQNARVTDSSDRFFRKFVDLWLAFSLLRLVFQATAMGGFPYVSLLMVLVGGSTRWAIHVHHMHLARRIFVLGVCASIVAVPYFVLGVATPVLAGMPMLLLVAGWTLGRRAMLWLAGAFVVAIGAYWLAQSQGWWQPQGEARTLLQWAFAWATVVALTAMIVWSLVANYEANFNEETRLRQQLGEALARAESSNVELHSVLKFNETILRSSPLPIGVYAADGSCVAANDAYASLVGSSRAALLAENWGTKDDWRAAGLSDACITALATNVEQRRDTELATADGRLLSLDCHILPAQLNGQRHLLVQLLDVTARKRSELRLREALVEGQRLRDALETVSAQIFIKDRAGRYIYANKRVCDALGQPLAAIVGASEERFVAPALASQIASDEVRVLAHGERIECEQVHVDSASGEQRVDWSVKSPILDEHGQVIGMCGIATDITQVKRTEEDLRAARLAAEAASRAKSAFLANMSHEIRTPMNGILGMLKLLEHTALNTRQLDYARKAEQATEALLGIINDILDFSKVEAGKLELDSHPFALGELMRELSVMLSANLGNKPIELVFAIDPGLPLKVEGDAMRLRQALLNLAGNALKFTEQGEIVVAIAVRARQENMVELEFSVSDSGIGIAADKLAHIFEGFSQAESSTSRRFGGTGLGLAISARLVTLMGGQLQVHSEAGRGSRFGFSLRLPVVEESRGASPLSGWRVLVVDDNAMARTVLHEISAAMGWRCALADGGLAALDQFVGAAHDPFHLVLIDWKMPDMDGWETARQIRRLATPEQTPLVIMLSAHGHEPLASKPPGEEALIDAYLVKPVTASMIHDAVLEAAASRAGPVAPRQLHQASACLAGLHLLVVEDNPLNQQIAQELLTEHGARVDLVGGGIEGVSHALDADPPYDAILMDMQMPDMDGLEATRIILADLRMARVPIIAMTANAMEVDREACRAAGMVDHISKPVDLERLLAIILRHTGRATPHEAPATTAIEADLLIDRVNAIRRLGGNHDLYQQIIEQFGAEARAHMARIEREAEQENWTVVLRELHTLRGLAGTLGASVLATTIVGAEAALKREPGAAAEDALKAVAPMLANTLIQLDILRQSPEHPAN